MNFMTVVPETMSNGSLEVSNSGSSAPAPFVSSQSELFADDTASLDHVAKTLEQFVADLNLHKSRIEDTYQRFIKYSQESEERQLSSEIFNAHFRHFKDTFVKFLKYIKYEHLTSTSGNPKSEVPLEAVKTIDSFEDSEFTACQKLLQYSDKEDTCEKVCFVRVGELVGLVCTVCEISKGFARRYWDQEVHSLLKTE